MSVVEKPNSFVVEVCTLQCLFEIWEAKVDFCVYIQAGMLVCAKYHILHSCLCVCVL